MAMSTMTDSSMPAMSSMAPASMSSSMPGMDMSGMSDMGSSGSMADSSMSGMPMTFYASTSTPLWSMAWTPSTTGQYAGTCIFLIMLALTLRALLTLRSVMEKNVWQTWKLPKSAATNGTSQKGDAQAGLRQTVKAQTRPWRLSVDGTRAILDLVTAGVGYLLMLAVMTFNVGYFLSVLAGIFLGSLVLGRYSASGTHMPC